jgi:hypothetical protein
VKYCYACAVAKSKQNNMVKVSDHVNSKVDGEIMFLDLSSIQPTRKEGVIPISQWRMLVDDAANLKISHWFAKKNEMVEPTCELIKMLGNNGIAVKI